MNGYRSTFIKGKQYFLPLYLLKKYLKNTNSEIVQEKPKNNQARLVFDLGSNIIVAITNYSSWKSILMVQMWELRRSNRF